MKKQLITTIAILFTLYLMCNVSALIIQSVNTVPDKIAPGKEATVYIVVKNDLEDDITDFNAKLDLTTASFAPYNSGADYSTDEIREGKTREIEFSIIALNDAKPGIYKIPLVISYKVNDEVKTMNSVISAVIQSEPIIEISREDSVLIKGKENKLNLKIINKGLADAKFLEAELTSSTYYSIVSENSVYIGDVDSDDYQNAEYSILFKDTMPNRIIIPVTLKYKDTLNNEYTLDQDLDIRVYSNEEATNLGLVPRNNSSIIVVVIVVVIILIIIYYVFIRRKRRKKIENGF
jgi:hypothetical protein